MLGMAGFASLMIYEIMQIIFKHKSSLSSLYISAIIPVVVTSSALSVLLFASHTYLALENNYTPYLNNQGGRFSFLLLLKSRCLRPFIESLSEWEVTLMLLPLLTNMISKVIELAKFEHLLVFLVRSFYKDVLFLIHLY